MNLSNYTPNLQELALLETLKQKTATDVIERNTLIYIAGYVAHRFRNTQSFRRPNQNTDIPTDWLLSISRGNCMYPSTDFLRTTDIMNREYAKTFMAISLIGKVTFLTS